MEEHGRIICVCQPQTGTSQRTGQPWMSQDYVMHIDGRYERDVYFSLWGEDRINRANLQVGEYITMKGEVEAHEYQGRWYNEIRCYDVLKYGRSVFSQGYQSPQQSNVMPTPGVPPVPTTPRAYPTENEYNANNYAHDPNQGTYTPAPGSGGYPQR